MTFPFFFLPRLQCPLLPTPIHRRGCSWMHRQKQPQLLGLLQCHRYHLVPHHRLYTLLTLFSLGCHTVSPNDWFIHLSASLKLRHFQLRQCTLFMPAFPRILKKKSRRIFFPLLFFSLSVMHSQLQERMTCLFASQPAFRWSDSHGNEWRKHAAALGVMDWFSKSPREDSHIPPGKKSKKTKSCLTHTSLLDVHTL